LTFATLATAETRIVPSGKENIWLELPKQAVVTDRDDTGQRWKRSGEIPVSFTVARKDFEVALQRQGWKRKQTIPMAVVGQRSELTTWTKDRRTVYLMLQEDGPGRCAWSLGEDP
jgi:hypothetical protein